SPMLWVIPLALYLATFVIVFQTKPVLPHRWVVLAEPAFIILLVAVLVFAGLDQIFLTVTANIVVFFVIALTCHGELARRRPAARHLTAFYMWMSTGGMIGGIAAGLIAPHVFSTVAEYPILIVLAILCRPGVTIGQGLRENLVWGALVVLALTVAVAGPVLGYTMEETKYKYVIATLLAVSVLFWRDPLKFAAMIALTFVVIRLYGPEAGGRDYVRSFFGVHKIFETADGEF